jgi:hypothetical protein
MDGTSTSGAPSAGNLILNNSTQSSATAMHVDDADDDGNSLDAFERISEGAYSQDDGEIRFDFADSVQLLNGETYFLITYQL